MQSPPEQAKKTRCNIAELFQLLANGAVLLGIFFAVFQLRQTANIASIRLAVEATNPTRTANFLSSYKKLLDAHQQDPSMLNTDSLDDDLNFVMSVYDNIAILYIHNLADRKIIRNHVSDAMKRLTPVLQAKKWPPELRVNFDAAISQMSNSN